MPRLPILVITTSLNEVSKPVVDLLREKKQDIIVFATDKVLSGSVEFKATVSNGEVALTYDGRTLLLSMLGSAWYWRPDVHYDNKDYARRKSVEREMKYTFQGIWDCVENSTWLNSPRRMYETQNKIFQGLRAQHVNLFSPSCVLTNMWRNIDTLGEKTIIKMPGMGTIDGDDARVLYTTVIDRQLRTKIMKSSPFPGIHQPYIPKKREWRITVVGKKVFPVAIYTHESAKDDWRKHQDDSKKVHFKSEPLPDKSIEAKCKTLLKKLGLRYGAFDFIETPSGEMVFLEVNPAGQYGWLEDELGLPISEAIADLLIEIADKRERALRK